MVWPSQEMTNGILIWFRIYFRCFISLDFKYISVYAPFKWLPGLIKGLPRWLSSKESACRCRRCGLDPWVRKIPGSGRSPGEGNGNPLQYSCLENSMDRGAWHAAVYGVARVGHNLVIKPGAVLFNWSFSNDGNFYICTVQYGSYKLLSTWNTANATQKLDF